MKSLREFMDGPARNAWIEYPNTKVYVRKSVRYIGKTLYQCLDVANVEVSEAKRSKGIFTAWLKLAESVACNHEFDAVYVENLLEPRLAAFLARRGYETIQSFGGFDHTPCMYKLCSQIKEEQNECQDQRRQV